MSIYIHQVLFPGANMLNKRFEHTDIRRRGLRVAHPVLPIRQAHDNLLALHFDGENVLPGNGLVTNLQTLLTDLDSAEGDSSASIVGGDGCGQQTSVDLFIDDITKYSVSQVLSEIDKARKGG